MEFSLEKIKQAAENYHVMVFPAVESTNDTLKKMASSGAPSGTVIFADRQTAGKGRMGRSFYSPEGGFYMSLLLKPPALTHEDVGMLTVYTAALVAPLLEELTGLKVGIKWVNDLYVESRKIGGILCESVMDSSQISYAVIGIGINLSTEHFPDSAGPAGSVKMAGGKVPDKNELAVMMLQRLRGLCESSLFPFLLAEYRRRSILLGEYVKIVGGDGKRLLAVGIDDDGGLVVMDEQKILHTIRCGEVSAVLDKTL